VVGLGRVRRVVAELLVALDVGQELLGELGERRRRPALDKPATGVVI
jgi:hypothetical protein